MCRTISATHYVTCVLPSDTLAFIMYTASEIACYQAAGPSPCRLRLKCDGTRAETRFRLSAKRTSPLISAGASVQSNTGSRGVRISGSNARYTMFRGSVKGTGYSILQFPPHFPTRASPCSSTFQLDSTVQCPPTYVCIFPSQNCKRSSCFSHIVSL
jgi:hypothetical protein